LTPFCCRAYVDTCVSFASYFTLKGDFIYVQTHLAAPDRR